MTHTAPTPIRGVRQGEFAYHEVPDLSHLEAVTTVFMSGHEKDIEREAAKQRVLQGFIEAVTEKGYFVPKDLSVYGGLSEVKTVPPELTDGD